MTKKYNPIIIKTLADFLRITNPSDIDISDDTLDMLVNVSPVIPDDKGKYADSWEALCAYMNDHITFVSLENDKTINIADFYGFAKKHWYQILRVAKRDGLTRGAYEVELNPLGDDGEISDDDLDFVADSFFSLIYSGNAGYGLCESLLKAFDPKKKYPYCS